MKTVLAFFLLLSSAFGGHTVGIKVEGVDEYGQRFTARGSAVVLDKTDKGYWVAVTAKHVVKNADAVYIGLSGKWHRVANVYPDPEADQDAAFITFSHANDLKGVTVADADIAAGEEITYSGFSGGSTWAESSGKTTGIGLASCRVRPRQGQSGGGVYDRRGRLIGIVSGYDQHGNLVYEPICRVRRSCIRHWGFFWGISIAPPVVVVPPPVIVQQSPPVNVIPAPRSVPPTEAMPVAPPPPVEDTPPPVVEQPAKPAECPCRGECKCNLDELKAEIAALKATKIPVQILRQDGTVFDQAEYRLGSPIKLKLAPVEKKSAAGK